MAIQGHTGRSIFTPEETEVVRSELDSILKSAHFLGSKRCHDFLVYIVSRALEGDFEGLAERFLGADLFGRPIDYDTKSDSIVRVCANDVRRRLADYYSEQRSVPRAIISLKSGSYVPEFHWPSPAGVASSPPPAYPPSPASPSLEPAAHVKAGTGTRSRKRLILILIGAVLLVVSGVLLGIRMLRPSGTQSAMERFWQPVIQNRSGVIICFSDSTSYWLPEVLRQAVEDGRALPPAKANEISVTKGDFASSGNVRAALSIMSLLDYRGVHNELRWPQEAQAAELEKSNVVYIGAFSNPATMNLNENLRFSFKHEAGGDGPIWMIVDRLSPNKKWSTTRTYPAPVENEYALITRILDTARNRVVISVGGLNWFGTQAAGEFLTDQAAMTEFARSAPSGWEHRNIQIVLEMGVTGKRAVNPRIVATNVW